MHNKPGARRQKELIPWWQVDLGGEAAEAAFIAVSTKFLSQGPITRSLEEDLERILGTSHAIATSSGSTALTLALIAAGARPGDTVLCPNYTWIATAHAAHILGCRVQLVDIEEERPVMDVSSLTAIKGQRVFAIPVHMNGHATDVDGLLEKGYTVIEDAAQALGSSTDVRMLGTLGHMGCFSFSVSKIIGSGQGGMVVTSSDDLAKAAREARTHGVVDVFAPDQWRNAGHNFRFNDVLAAILRTQIPKLDGRLEHVRQLSERYDKSLSKIPWIRTVKHRDSSELGPYVEARVSTPLLRDKLATYLLKKGVGVRKAFPPLSSAGYLGHQARGSFPNAEKWSSEVLYLPSGPGLAFESADLVSDYIMGFKPDRNAF